MGEKRFEMVGTALAVLPQYSENPVAVQVGARAWPSSFSNPDELLILANGPSLNRTVEDSTDFIKGKTLLAVNFCVSSPMFERLLPRTLSDCRSAVLDRSREAYTAFQDNGREDYLGYELLCPCPCPEE